MGIDYKLDINSLSQIEDGSPIGKNDICRAKIKVSKSLMIDSYSKNRGTGSIILVDNSTNETVGAGMVI
jgi:sulfate adenylyltransferase subunit 1